MIQSSRQIAVPHAHDAVFRQFLTHPEIARDFIELHLPEEFKALCDLDTLKLESGAFVDSDLHHLDNDVLYSVQTKEGKGYIHVLIEHQSTPDKHMAFRLIRYAVAAMQRHLDAGHDKLPLVIPILFYHGKRRPYPYTTNWLHEFDDPVLAAKLYANPFPLVDVTDIPDDEIMEHRGMAALTLTQKHIYQRDISTLMDRLAALLVADHLPAKQVKALINYLLQVGESADAEALVRQLAQRVPQYGDALMTIAQELEKIGIKKGIEQGIQRGEQRGLEKGRNEGRSEGKREVARSLLKMGMSCESVLEATGLTPDDLVHIRD